MVVSPRIRGFICTTAHPVGCERGVQSQIEYVKERPRTEGKKRVLVIGASMGYGLATRIAAAYQWGASTLGVFYDRPSDGAKTASAGWYNTAAFTKQARLDGLYAANINGDAFSREIKRAALDTVKKDLGQVDMVVYSMAAPRRQTPDKLYSSALKPVGGDYSDKTIDIAERKLKPVSIPAATDEEIEGTVKVMGGEDWALWIDALMAEDLLAPGAITLAFSYIGPSMTAPLYRAGTVGRAKEHLEATAHELTQKMAAIGGNAYVSVNKGLVTQSSSAIPVVPLYIAILYRVMKTMGIHEGCIEQMDRMLREKLNPAVTDAEGRLRLDDLEMRPDVQAAVRKAWDVIANENLAQLADLDGYDADFLSLFGFGLDGVDYAADVDIDVKIGM